MAGCLGYFENNNNEEEEQYFDWITPELLLGNRVRSSPALNHYDGCAELEEDLRSSMIEEMMVGLDQASYWHWNSWGFRGGMMVDDMAMEMDGGMAMPETTGSDSSNSMDSSSPPSTSGAGDREGQYSETNNQEEGVDEADFLKTDGYHIYMINNGQLVILGVPEFGNITLESNMTLEGSPMQMLVSGDQLVIISSVSYWDLEIDDPVRIAMMVDNSEDEREYSYYRYSNKVKYSVLNITNRSDPQIDRELYLDGSYQTSRLVDGTLRAVTHSYAQLQGLQTYPDLPESY